MDLLTEPSLMLSVALVLLMDLVAFLVPIDRDD